MAGVKQELELLGYTSQAAFLLDCGLLELVQRQLESLTKEADKIDLSRVVKNLTMPGEMGEKFQVMALGKDYDSALSGFRSLDLAYRL